MLCRYDHNLMESHWNRASFSVTWKCIFPLESYNWIQNLGNQLLKICDPFQEIWKTHVFPLKKWQMSFYNYIQSSWQSSQVLHFAQFLTIIVVKQFGISIMEVVIGT